MEHGTERDELVGTRSLPRSQTRGANPAALRNALPSPRGRTKSAPMPTNWPNAPR